MVLEEIPVWHVTVRDAPRAVEELQLVPFEAMRQPGGDAEDEQGDDGEAGRRPNPREPLAVLRSHDSFWHKAGVDVVPSPPSAAHHRRLGAAVIGIALAALALRLLHLRAVRPLVIDVPPPPGMDRWLNMEIATAIARGEWLGGWAVPYDSSPGYSYLLAALYRLSGERWIGPAVVQLALGALTPIVLAGAVRRLRDEKTAVVAALLAALYLPAIFYEGLLVKFSLVPFATAILLYATVRLQEGTRRWALGAGVALAALALLRPNTMLVAPVVGWAALRGLRPSAAASRVAFVACGAALLMVPMAVRDHLAAERGVPSALGGIHFYIGSNPQADGEYVVLPRIRPDIVGHVVDARREAERRVGHRLSPEEASRFWFHQGLAFIREDPGRYVLLELRKLWFVLEANESGSFGDDFDALRPASPVLRLPLVTFGVVMPLAAVGVLGCLRRRAWLLPAFALSVAVSLLPFFVAGRYRIPLAPPVIALAALGLDHIGGRGTGRGSVRLAAVGLGLPLLAILSGADDVQVATLLGTLAIGVGLVRWLPPSSAACASIVHVPEGAQPREDSGIDLGSRPEADHRPP